MIVVDSNVISEMMRPVPSPKVKHWFDSQRFPFTTAITQAEILYGLELLPSGKRRTAFVTKANEMFQRLFADRILPFDSNAALVYSVMAATRRHRGQPLSQLDGQIASISRVHGAALATRNTRDFEHCGLELVNPWIDG